MAIRREHFEGNLLKLLIGIHHLMVTHFSNPQIMEFCVLIYYQCYQPSCMILIVIGIISTTL